ncbi:MAG: hypothetical protein ABIP02_08685, partial [Arenimonas sp.]
AASLAFAAIVFVPGMMQNKDSVEPKFANNNLILAEPDATPTFASADLIADSPSAVSTSVRASASTPAGNTAAIDNSSKIEAVADLSSPENFPLNVNSEKKTWPRSAVNANSDPALEAYLVRHNQMMAQDGMGGFVPYVDVVAQDAEQSKENTNKNAGGNK